MNLYSYSNSLISRLFTVLDLTKSAQSMTDFSNIETFIDSLILEIEGSLKYFEEVKYGNQITSVVMKLNGIKTVSDYNVRRKVVLDSIDIIHKVQSELDER